MQWEYYSDVAITCNFKNDLRYLGTKTVLMKNVMKNLFTTSLFVLTASVFVQAGCSKSGEDVETEHPLPTADQYVTWHFGNTHGTLQSPTDSLFCYDDNGTTSIAAATAFNATNQGGFYTSFNAMATGNFQLNDLIIYANQRSYVSTSTPMQVKVSAYGNAGQYVVGSYNGFVKDSTTNGQQSSTTYAISGHFRVKRS